MGEKSIRDLFPKFNLIIANRNHCLILGVLQSYTALCIFYSLYFDSLCIWFLFQSHFATHSNTCWLVCVFVYCRHRECVVYVVCVCVCLANGRWDIIDVNKYISRNWIPSICDLKWQFSIERSADIIAFFCIVSSNIY